MSDSIETFYNPKHKHLRRGASPVEFENSKKAPEGATKGGLVSVTAARKKFSDFEWREEGEPEVFSAATGGLLNRTRAWHGATSGGAHS